MSESLSVQELTRSPRMAIGSWPRLTPQERNALAPGGLRFRVDRPVVVEVATPARRFRSGSTTLGSAGRPARSGSPAPTGPSTSKPFPAGWVGLGVNGLDRTPKAHYSSSSVPPSRVRYLELDGIDPDAWRIVAPRDGASAAFDVDLTDRAPARPPARLALAPAGERPAARGDAGAVAGLEDALRVGPDARPGRRGLRPRPGRQPRLDLADRSERGDDSPSAGHRPRATRAASWSSRATRRPVESPGLLNDPTIRRHRVVATRIDARHGLRLQPRRRLAAGLDVLVPGSDRPRRDRDRSGFLYMGDPQCGLEEWGKLLASAHGTSPRRRRSCSSPATWSIGATSGPTGTTSSSAQRASSSALPLMPCVGNHEYLDQGPAALSVVLRTAAERSRAGSIRTSSIRSNTGNAFVAVLDSTLALADPEASRNQAELARRGPRRGRMPPGNS